MTRWTAAATAALAIVVFALCAHANGIAAIRGWLCAFVLISMIPIGSLALLLVHGISGGRWGEDFAPALVPAARCIPLLFVAFLPVLLFRPLIYQWQELGIPHDVGAHYLNPVFFDARSLIALAIWSLLAWTAAWRSSLFAGLGLLAHAILVTLIPADWILTIRPGSTSAGFGLGFGIEQMFAAAAFSALLAPQGRDARANRDLAGILVTLLLGTMYFLYMQYIVIWYGNIPDKVHWFAARADRGWSLAVLAAFIIGAALPFLAILNPSVRREPAALRIAGVLVLTGISLHVGWMILPVFGIVAILPAIAAALVMAFLIGAGSKISPIAAGAHGL